MLIRALIAMLAGSTPLRSMMTLNRDASHARDRRM
jgi:hypothetical protein